MNEEEYLLQATLKRAEQTANRLQAVVTANDNQPWNGKERRKSLRLEIFNKPVFNFLALDSHPARGHK